MTIMVPANQGICQEIYHGESEADIQNYIRELRKNGTEPSFVDHHNFIVKSSFFCSDPEVF
jgi:hypothetical protein